MGTLITFRVKLVAFVLIALLAAATVGCTDSPSLEGTDPEPESCDPSDDVNCEPSSCDEGDEDCDAEAPCDEGEEDCEQSLCDEGTECDFDPTLSATDRLFDTADLPEGLEWSTRFDDTIGDDGVCNGSGLAEIVAVEDSAAATFVGEAGQVTQVVFDFASAEEAATVLDTTVTQAGCGSWTEL